jgi:hypothetical protein
VFLFLILGILAKIGFSLLTNREALAQAGGGAPQASRVR